MLNVSAMPLSIRQLRVQMLVSWVSWVSWPAIVVLFDISVSRASCEKEGTRRTITTTTTAAGNAVLEAPHLHCTVHCMIDCLAECGAMTSVEVSGICVCASVCCVGGRGERVGAQATRRPVRASPTVAALPLSHGLLCCVTLADATRTFFQRA